MRGRYGRVVERLYIKSRFRNCGWGGVKMRKRKDFSGVNVFWCRKGFFEEERNFLGEKGLKDVLLRRWFLN